MGPDVENERTTKPERAASALDDGVERKRFEELCTLLPGDVNWFDPITPNIVREIVIAIEDRERTRVAALVADDGYAMTFQSLGQYRSALLAGLRSNVELTGPCAGKGRQMTTELPMAQSPVDVTVRGQAIENIATQVARSRDGVIASAITSAIGDGWTLASLGGRLVCKIYPDKVEVVELDGKEILELHPIRFEQVTEGCSIKIKAVQGYRALGPNV